MKQLNFTVIPALVKRSGGFTALGREFGVTGWAVQKWSRCGLIPAARVPMVCELAALHGIEVKPWQLRPDIYRPSMFIPSP